jgi:3-oxoacyl-[acyl-carrier-protein] synthase-3
MARSIIRGVRFAGLSVCVPHRIKDNLDVPESELKMRERLVRNIGIRNRRLCSDGKIFSDLAERAVEDLLQALNWDKSTIDAYIWVTQSPDYIIPATSIVSQARVGLPKTTMAFDINLGCSGYPYGLYTAACMIGPERIKRAICVIGDQSGSEGSPDSGREILFGDAATATALEFDESAPPMYFEGFSDGSGYKAIIIPDGGRKSPVRAESLIPTPGEDGVIRTGVDVTLDGPAILNFSTAVAPDAVNRICEYSGVPLDQVDGVILHQANRMINETIRRKLGLPPERVPESLNDFGNTSSASIPVTLVHRSRDRFLEAGSKWALCGFGIGLSWATLLVESPPGVYCSRIIEL